MSLPRRAAGAAAALGLAAAAAVSAASPAAAQYPGANGQLSYNAENTLVVPCMGPYDGSGPFDYFPAGGITWAADGRTVAMVVNSHKGDYATVAVVDTATCSLPVELGPVDDGSDTSFSPSGTEIAVVRGGDIWVLDARTGAAHRDLTPNTAGTAEHQPSWDPKNTGVAYTASDGIRIRPPQGGASRLWKKGVVNPDYAPDGSKIAYQLPDTRIAYAAKGDGSSVRTTAYQAYDYTWSPDGTRFFAESSLDIANCAVTDLTGRIIQRVENGGPAFCAAPAWQPKH